jgi:hypothetical protein
VGLFKERKKFALLSLLSALVVVSTAFVGISIYAQTDDSDMTTFEEEEANPTEETTAMDNTTSVAEESTSIADVESLFDGLVVCNVGTAEISGETEVASVDNASLTTPTVSAEVMTETEVAELAANETETASADNETSTASANCVEVDVSNATSTSGTNATDAANTSTASSNATLAGNASNTANATGTGNATSLGSSNQTSTASAPQSDRQILVIDGQDFVPGQAVLIWTENALLAIDDVDSDGSIQAKVPMPEAGGTAIASNDTASMSTELRFVESGTQRTATFEFDGQTLTAAAGGEIEVEGGEGSNAGTSTAATAPSDNTTSTNNNTGSNYTVQ